MSVFNKIFVHFFSPNCQIGLTCQNKQIADPRFKLKFSLCLFTSERTEKNVKEKAKKKKKMKVCAFSCSLKFGVITSGYISAHYQYVINWGKPNIFSCCPRYLSAYLGKTIVAWE